MVGYGVNDGYEIVRDTRREQQRNDVVCESLESLARM